MQRICSFFNVKKKERERERRKEMEEKSRKQGKSQFDSCARNVERKKKIGEKKGGEKNIFPV